MTTSTSEEGLNALGELTAITEGRKEGGRTGAPATRRTDGQVFALCPDLKRKQKKIVVFKFQVLFEERRSRLRTGLNYSKESYLLPIFFCPALRLAYFFTACYFQE